MLQIPPSWRIFEVRRGVGFLPAGLLVLWRQTEQTSFLDRERSVLVRVWRVDSDLDLPAGEGPEAGAVVPAYVLELRAVGLAAALDTGLDEVVDGSAGVVVHDPDLRHERGVDLQVVEALQVNLGEVDRERVLPARLERVLALPVRAELHLHGTHLVTRRGVQVLAEAVAVIALDHHRDVTDGRVDAGHPDLGWRTGTGQQPERQGDADQERADDPQRGGGGLPVELLLGLPRSLPLLALLVGRDGGHLPLGAVEAVAGQQLGHPSLNGGDGVRRGLDPQLQLVQPARGLGPAGVVDGVGGRWSVGIGGHDSLLQ